MPKSISTERKTEAFQLLFETFGDVYYVSKETGISERALRYWKSNYRIEVKRFRGEPLDPKQVQYKEHYRTIRDKLLERIDSTLSHLETHNTPEMAATLTPSLTRLIDRLAKLEELIDENHIYFTMRWIDPEEPVIDEAVIRYREFPKY